MNTNKKDIDPSAAGRMLAKYIPADPQIFYEAAMANGYKVGLVEHAGRRGLCTHIDGVPKDVYGFFFGWLSATPGADHALAVFLERRGLTNISYE